MVELVDTMGLKPIPIQWGVGSNPTVRTKEEFFGETEPPEDGRSYETSSVVPELLERTDLSRVAVKVIISLYRGFHLFIALQGDSQLTNVGYFACSGWSLRVLLAMLKYMCDKLSWEFNLEGEKEFIQWISMENPWPPYHETK